jgi:hypothetical protein
MLVGKEHNPTLEKISKLNFKLVVFLTVAFSLLMNIGHCFQFQINYGLEEILGSSESTFDLYPIIVSLNSAFKWYSVVYFFVDFALFLAINTCVEFTIFLKLRKEIAIKKVKTEAEILLSRSKNTSGSEVINKIIRRKQKKIDQDEKKNTRTIVMVITNSCLNFILRLPEIFVFLSANNGLLTSLFGNFYVDISDALFSSLSSLLVSSSYLFYIITFPSNVAFYYLFNPIFKQHFIRWKSNLKRQNR